MRAALAIAGLGGLVGCGSSQPPIAETPIAHREPVRHPLATSPPACVAAFATRIRGCVRDRRTGALVPGATVIVLAADGAQQIVLTNAIGAWGVDVRGGSVTITAYYADDAEREVVEVPADEPSTLVPDIVIDVPESD